MTHLSPVLIWFNLILSQVRTAGFGIRSDRVAAAFAHAAGTLGAEIETGCAADEIETAGGAVIGVRGERGEVRASTVVFMAAQGSLVVAPLAPLRPLTPPGAPDRRGVRLFGNAGDDQ
jgi:glycine/D-amino acid oxidase-like deaminating enzyme